MPGPLLPLGDQVGDQVETRVVTQVTRVTGAYFITFWWFRCLFVQLLPCISLVILNILLFSAMRRAEQRRRRLTINKTKPVKKARVARKNTMAR